ncbi:LPD29 domain-containing protein [Streptomyces sp. NPDC046374]|uniref:LPD29 domain-containing protein n=1 Tax=Streptomyces sp. NPDC046374 TaxID=3154917 RepID=UPI0034004F7B
MDDSKPKERASQLRRALRNRYQNVTLRVTSVNAGTEYGGITIKWTDGPTRNEVDQFAKPYGDRALRYGGITCERDLSTTTRQIVTDIWDAAAAPTPDRKIYPAEGGGLFREWDHEGHTVPEASSWLQKVWLADHIVLPANGQGIAMNTEPEPEHEHDKTEPRPALRVLPGEAKPSAGAQRKETAIGLLRTMAHHIEQMPESMWEIPVKLPEEPTEAEKLWNLQRVSNLVTGAVVAELSGLVSATHGTRAVDVPSKQANAQALVRLTIERMVTASNPVLRAVAQIQERPK